MARSKGGSATATPTKSKKKRKGIAYTEPALLDLARPGARLLLANKISYLIGIGNRSRFINEETYDDLRAHDYITLPELVGGDYAECVLSEQGRHVASLLIDSGFSQINFEQEYDEFKGLEKKKEEETPRIF